MKQTIRLEAAPDVKYGPHAPPAAASLLTSPARMNAQYSWTLNIYPRVSEVCEYLRRELTKVSGEAVEARFEPANNVFMLCCAIADTANDYMLGASYDFSRAAIALPRRGL